MYKYFGSGSFWLAPTCPKSRPFGGAKGGAKMACPPKNSRLCINPYYYLIDFYLSASHWLLMD